MTHPPLHVALLGFSSIERGAIAAAIADGRGVGWRLVTALDDGDLLLADAEHAPAVNLVLATERLSDTVFVGGGAPAGAAACVPRPIDPYHLMRELAALMVARQAGGAAPATLARMRVTASSSSAPLSTPLPLPLPLTFPSPFPPPFPMPFAPSPAAAVAALVVDASDNTPNPITQPLQRWGFDVEQASHSSQALARLSRRSFDCVFIGLSLGRESALDGLALCQHLKRLPRPGRGAAPWVALLATNSSQAERVQGALAGCDAFLAQPVEEAELLRLLWRQGWAPPPPRQPAPGRAGAPPGQTTRQPSLSAVPSVLPPFPQPPLPPARA